MKSVAITGALSYTGRYLSKALLDSGTSSVLSFSRRKVPISSHILSPTDLSRITTAPLNFDDREGMKEKLEGVDVLFCTYWIRFEKFGDTHEKAAKRVREVRDWREWMEDGGRMEGRLTPPPIHSNPPPPTPTPLLSSSLPPSPPV